MGRGMRVLALDTATSATTVALGRLPDPPATAGGAAATHRAAAPESLQSVLELRDDPPLGSRPRHTTRLLPLVTELLARSGQGWESVDRIAVGLGPGTFTGLRIGVASAQALARARGIPLLGVSTLASLALGAAGEAARAGSVVAVLDARRGEVFAAAWACDALPPAPPILSPAALAPARLAHALSGLPAPLAAGDGAIAFRTILGPAGVAIPVDDSPVHLVSAAVHLRLAAGPADDQAGSLTPQYLRRPDAERARRR